MRTPEEDAQFEYVDRAYQAAVAKLLSGGYATLNEVDRTVYLTWIVDAEVNNGGFDQYFFNSSADQASDVPAALERIGAPQAAALVQRAIATFPEARPSRDWNARQQQLDALPEDAREALSDLDEEWYRNPEDLESALARYLRQKTAQ